jgi:hypothetical protein
VGTRKARPLYKNVIPFSLSCAVPGEKDIRELAVQLRNDLPDGLGSAGGRGNNIVVDAATSTPVLGGRSVNGLLGCSSCVNGAHETLDNAKLVVDDFRQGSKAISGTGGIGNLLAK